ncbi:hypothetical protein E2562_038046 [Oryza meyeriana var. granulata]|uniref:Uncharacterized protein n=1 Tax=Oryza meyeriana var. granulata TaxID=110450 RepID=A0A6G1EU60_9ORYZ|nr:hypothetical protein E2562_038046 [Oryza meyeriana var. granulata]
MPHDDETPKLNAAPHASAELRLCAPPAPVQPRRGKAAAPARPSRRATSTSRPSRTPAARPRLGRRHPLRPMPH